MSPSGQSVTHVSPALVSPSGQSATHINPALVPPSGQPITHVNPALMSPSGQSLTHVNPSLVSLSGQSVIHVNPALVSPSQDSWILAHLVSHLYTSTLLYCHRHRTNGHSPIWLVSYTRQPRFSVTVIGQLDTHPSGQSAIHVSPHLMSLHRTGEHPPIWSVSSNSDMGEVWGGGGGGRGGQL